MFCVVDTCPGSCSAFSFAVAQGAILPQSNNVIEHTITVIILSVAELVGGLYGLLAGDLVSGAAPLPNAAYAFALGNCTGFVEIGDVIDGAIAIVVFSVTLFCGWLYCLFARFGVVYATPLSNAAFSLLLGKLTGLVEAGYVIDCAIAVVVFSVACFGLGCGGFAQERP